MRVESQTIEGYFWLPETPDHKVSGKLLISERGDVNLEIMGAITKDCPMDPDELHRVHGQLENGKAVTIEPNFFTNRSLSLPGMAKSKLSCRLVIIGAFFDAEEDIAFDRVKFAVEGLNEWVGISGIKVENNWKEKTGSIHFTPPEEETHILDDGNEFSIRFQWTLPSSGPATTEAKITQKSLIEISSSNGLLPLKVYAQYIYRFTNFLCLAHDKPLALTYLEAYHPDIHIELTDKQVPQNIEVIYPSLPHPDKEHKTDIFGLLFNYKAVSENFAKVLSNWLKDYDELEPAFNLYFAATGSDNLYLDNKFLFLVQGLETLHRRTNPNKTHMEPKQYKELKELLLNSCTEEHKQWLKSKLQYANEVSLRQRLKDLIEPVSEYFGNNTTIKTLLNDTVNTRNYLTHFDKTAEKKAKRDEDLLNLFYKLEVLFKLILLKRIGLDEEQITEAIKRSGSILYKLQTL
jgi:hypothetical protein